MPTILKVYDQEGNVVGQAEQNQDDTTKVTIYDLEPDTTYPTGAFKVAHVNGDEVSEMVDVPEFKTKESKRKSKAQS